MAATQWQDRRDVARRERHVGRLAVEASGATAAIANRACPRSPIAQATLTTDPPRRSTNRTLRPRAAPALAGRASAQLHGGGCPELGSVVVNRYVDVATQLVSHAPGQRQELRVLALEPDEVVQFELLVGPISLGLTG